MVEELFPAFVSVVAEVDVDEGVVPGRDRIIDGKSRDSGIVEKGEIASSLRSSQ